MGNELQCNKCKIMHFGTNNPCYRYTMNSQILETTKNGKECGLVSQQQSEAIRTVREGSTGYSSPKADTLKFPSRYIGLYKQ
jgi:hypothetical protein